MLIKIRRNAGFTIVELLIVIVVIAILAAITIVTYSGVQRSAKNTVLMSGLASASKQLQLDKVVSDVFPATKELANGGKGLSISSGVTYRYRPDNTSATPKFCLTATNGQDFYMVTENSSVVAGSCYNVALGATTSAPSSVITDGLTATASFYDAGLGYLAAVTVDLVL